jgi:hypothetical protein
MLNFLSTRRKNQTVMGHRLEEPRLTMWALGWGLVYVGLPVLAVGLMVDAVTGYLTGSCAGLWCWL